MKLVKEDYINIFIGARGKKMKGRGSRVVAFVLATAFLFSMIQPNLLLKADLESLPSSETSASNVSSSDDTNLKDDILPSQTDEKADNDDSSTDGESNVPNLSENIPQSTEKVDEPDASEPNDTVPAASEVIPTEEPIPTITSNEMPKETLTAEQIAKLKELAEIKDKAVLLTNSSPLVRASELTVEQRETMPELALAMPAIDYPSENADSKIIYLTSTWITEDSITDNNPNLLSLKWHEANEKHVQMRVKFSLASNHDYAPGSFCLCIPKYIFKDREDKYIGVMDLSVPAAPDMSQVFAYTEEEDYYKIVNTKAMASASVGMFEFSIGKLEPHKIKDFANNNYTSDAFQATLTINTPNGIIGQISEELTVKVDTRAILTNASKRADIVYEKWPGSFPIQLKPENKDDYIYTRWTAFATTKASQTFNVKLKDEPTSTGKENRVIILGYQTADGQVIKNDDASLSTFEKDIFSGYANDGDNFYTSIYVAYPKNDFSEGKTYDLSNKATFTLTSTDDGEVNVKSASASLSYTPISFPRPKGHFYVNKYGYGNKLTQREDKTEGIYEGALNSLRDKKDIDITYRVQARGFGIPWTLDNDSDPNKIDSYGKYSYTLHITDDNVSFEEQGEKLEPGKDYIFKDLLFAQTTVYNYEKFETSGFGYKENISGNAYTHISYASIPRGEWGYRLDENAEKPVLTVSMLKKGEDTFVPAGTVTCNSGIITISPTNGASVTDQRLVFPDNVIAYKVDATTKKAAVIWDMYPTVTLKATDAVTDKVKNLFANSDAPQMRIKNMVSLDTDYEKNATTNNHINNDTAFDVLTGVAYGAKLLKTLTYDNDPRRNIINLHYNIKAIIQTNVSDMELLSNFLKQGLIDEQKQAVWYDLLPKGVNVDLNSIKLRSKDSIKEIKTITNYRNSQRTLLIVKADLKPQYRYLIRGMSILASSGYGDVPELSFDAIYAWDNYKELGANLVNHAVYESANKSLGTIPNLMGEPDDPKRGNNTYSETATLECPELLTNLNPSNDNPSFIYAKSSNNLVINTSGAFSANKRVDVNNEGWYSDGQDEHSARNVYEGGSYTYRLFTKNDESSKSKNIKFFDYLERHQPTGADTLDTTFRGRFVGLDLSELKQKGIEPVVYYSTQDNLQLNDKSSVNSKDVDLTNTSIWSTTEPADKSKVTAIAIDCSKKSDRTDFILEKNNSLAVYIKMQAPMVKDIANGVDNSQYYDTLRNNGEKEDGLLGGVHAYNGVIVTLNTISHDIVSETICNYFKYTKVGLKPHNVLVKKTWEDENDLECLRPKQVKVTLLADGISTGRTATLDASSQWCHEFTNLPYQNEKGEKVTYSIEEEVPKGYRVRFSAPKETSSGLELAFVNEHTPEMVTISGEKTWQGGKRPESVTVALYADGKQIERKSVGADNLGKWKYRFTKLYKYRKDERGKKQEINYTIKELNVPADYVVEYDNKYNILNRYNPYGNLSIRKELLHKSFVNADVDFEFVCNIFTQNGEQDFTSYEYDLLNNDKKIGSFTIASGQRFKLKAGYVVKIKNIPLNYTYKLSEITKDGYTLVTAQSDKLTGKIERETQVKLVNDYVAKGRIFISGLKKLEGSKLEANQFIFNIYDDKQKLYATSSNNLDGSIPFGYFDYTLADVGKTFVYTVKERIDNKSGYTYDKSEVKFTIKVEDNGDGTLKLTPTYPEHGLSFINKYEAKGSIQLVAWKQFTDNSKPKAGEFNFELYDYNDPNKKIVAKGTNDKNGVVNFSVINYTNQDIGKTYIYRAREVKPQDDDNYIYDTSECEYKVTVKDNKDGTLKFDITNKDLYTDDVHNGKNVPLFVNQKKPGALTISKVYDHNDGVDYSDYQNKYFKFKVKFDGLDPNTEKFTIERKTYKEESNDIQPLSNNANPTTNETNLLTQLKDFLGLNNNASNKENEPQVSKVLSSTSTNSTATENEIVRETAPQKNNNQQSAVLTFTGANLGQLTSKKANAPFVFGRQLTSVRARAQILTGTCAGEGGAKWTLNPDNGELRIEKDGNDAEIDRKILYFTINDGNTLLSALGEDTVKRAVKSVVIGDGCYTDFGTNYDGKRYFAGLYNLENVTISDGKFFKGFKSVQSLFESCRSLKNIKFPSKNIDQLQAKDASYMFAYCENLTNVDLSALNFKTFTSVRSMFDSCQNLKSVTFSQQLDTANLTNMQSMFENCFNIESIDLSCFDTKNVVNMLSLFSMCLSLKNIKFSSKFDTSNVTSMNNMFSICTEIEQLDLSSFKTPKVTDFSAMFTCCRKLKSLDLSSFDFAQATSIGSMFFGCSDMTSITFGNAQNTSNMTDFTYAFMSCSSLVSLDLSNWIISQNAETESMLDVRYYNDDAELDESISYKLQKISLGRNIAKLDECGLPNPIKGVTNKDNAQSTGKWIKEDKTSDAYSSEELINDWQNNAKLAGTWVWEYKDSEYEISFDKNDTSAVGSMANSKIKKDEFFVIPDCKFSNLHKRFLYWTDDKDGNGIKYYPFTKVKNITDSDSVTLYAQWQQLDTETKFEDNSLELYVKANEAVTIKNIKAGVKYAVYEETPSGWVLVKQVDTSGEIQSNQEAKASFVNSLNPNKAIARLGGMKLLDGKRTASYKFELIDVADNNKVIQTASSDASGMFFFADITYTEEGVHMYQIREVVDEEQKDNILYDPTVHTVTCTVKKDANDNLQAKFDKTPEDIVFNNKTKNVSLIVSKKVIGTTKSDVEFEMQVAFSNGRVESFKLKNNEQKTINNLPVGITYRVSELNLPSGYELDNVSQASGELQAGNEPIQVVVTNRYIVGGSVTVNLKKKLIGRELKSGEFSFVLQDEQGNTLGTATNDANGNISFGSIQLSKAGDLTWHVKEIQGEDPNITYDTRNLAVNVHASDEGNGRLSATVTYPDGDTFTNENTPPKKKITGMFTVHKEVKNAFDVPLSQANEQKKFSLKVNLQILDPKTKEFVALKGNYDYTSTNGQTGYISDTSNIKLNHNETITVKGLPIGTKVTIEEENAKGYKLDNGASKLVGSVYNAEAALALNLVNIYDAEGSLKLEGDKGVIGHTIEAKNFNFLVLEKGEVIQKATNDSNGKINFTDLHYTLKDAGTKHTYTIIEEKGLDSHYIYDKREYTCTVEVKDNGEGKLIAEALAGSDKKFNFTNRYRHDLPMTGKEDLLIAGSVGAMLLLIVLYLIKQKHRGGGSD